LNKEYNRVALIRLFNYILIEIYRAVNTLDCNMISEAFSSLYSQNINRLKGNSFKYIGQGNLFAITALEYLSSLGGLLGEVIG